MPFDDEAHAVELANDTEYGLSGSIFTATSAAALRVARAVEAGNLSVNSHSAVRYWTPFGGYKQSGLGRELGPDAPDGVHRGEERLHRPLGLTSSVSTRSLALATRPTKGKTWQDASRARSPSSPEAARASGWRPSSASSRRAPRS